MIWIILSVLLWGTLHSALASMDAKQLARRIFGARGTHFYRIAFNGVACISFLPVIMLLLLMPGRILYLVSMPWLLVMIAGQLLAVAAMLVGIRQSDLREFLGLAQLNCSSASDSVDAPLETCRGRLITGGLYRYVRHPLYTAGLAFIWLLPLMTSNILAANIGLTIYVVVGVIFEERKLFREFGQDYTEYAALTPMLIPIPWRNKTRPRASM